MTVMMMLLLLMKMMMVVVVMVVRMLQRLMVDVLRVHRRVFRSRRPLLQPSGNKQLYTFINIAK